MSRRQDAPGDQRADRDAKAQGKYIGLQFMCDLQRTHERARVPKTNYSIGDLLFEATCKIGAASELVLHGLLWGACLAKAHDIADVGPAVAATLCVALVVSPS